MRNGIGGGHPETWVGAKSILAPAGFGELDDMLFQGTGCSIAKFIPGHLFRFCSRSHGISFLRLAICRVKGGGGLEGVTHALALGGLIEMRRHQAEGCRPGHRVEIGDARPGTLEIETCRGRADFADEITRRPAKKICRGNGRNKTLLIFQGPHRVAEKTWPALFGGEWEDLGENFGRPRSRLDLAAG